MLRKPSIEAPLGALPNSPTLPICRQPSVEVKGAGLERTSSGCSGMEGMECQNLPSTRQTSEGEEAARLMRKLSLNNSSSTLSSGRLPARRPQRTSSLASRSSDGAFLGGFSVSEEKLECGKEEESNLGEQILHQQAFREQLEMLIMGHLQ